MDINYPPEEMEYVTWLRQLGHDEEYIVRAVYDSRLLEQMETELREIANGY